MGRKILFVTTDQQRYDTLGCNGGTVARTPVIDGLAAQGIRYERAHPQSVVCMPSRSTMITGQHPSTHGVWMNGVPLPVDAPVGGRGAARRRLPHRAHRQAALRAVPRPVRPLRREPLRSSTGIVGRCTAASSTSSPPPTARRARCTTPAGWRPTIPRRSGMFYPVLDRRWRSTPRAAATPARRRCRTTPSRREWYHTDWVADRTIAWLDSLGADDDWFCWMSFPDPHHPWDPPASELGRIDWRDVPLPAGYIADAAEREAHPRRQAAPLAGLVRRRAGVELRGAGRLGAGHAHRRPGPRGQRPQRRRVRADRRGARPRAGRDRRAAAGTTTSTSSSPPTTASCRATSGCCSRARTTSTG